MSHKTEQAADAAQNVAWECEINYMSCIVFATTKAKAKWIAVKGYWDAYSRSLSWPSISCTRSPIYDKSRLRDECPRAFTEDHVLTAGNN